MKLTIGVPDYPFRSMHEISGAKLKGRMKGRDVSLQLIEQDAMASLHETLPNIRGCPRQVSFDFKKQRICLHPTPDGEYELMIDSGDEKKEEKSIVGTITKAVLKGHDAR